MRCRRLLRLSCIVSLLSPLSTPAQTAPVVLSRWQVHRLIGSAHSSEEYERLAAYFHVREAMDERLSADQALRLRQENERPSFGKSYPTPLQTAEKLHAYYASRALEDGKREVRCHEQAEHLKHPSGGSVSEPSSKDTSASSPR